MRLRCLAPILVTLAASVEAVPQVPRPVSGETTVARSSYELLLRYARFDPLRSTPAVAPELAARPDSELFVVQYWAPGVEAYRSALRRRGVRIHLFLANHANVVRMSPELVKEIRALPFVRWVGPFHPAYKLEEGLLADSAWTTPTRRLNVVTFERGDAGHGPVVELVEALGARVEERTAAERMSATLTRNQVLAVASLDAVQWIDAWGAPEPDMNIARLFHGADHVEAMGGYTGQGVNVEVLDLGCDETHPELQNFILHGMNTPSAHGTATSGIVCGSGAINPATRGVLPDALLVIADIQFMTDRYQHTRETQVAPFECVLQSNSWGSPRTRMYTAISHELDRILFDFQRISILHAQGNSGNQESRPEAWAKNVISVGGIVHQNTLTPADDCWCFGASIGPATDGRVKPDVASFYDNVMTLAIGGGTASFGGTSASTPITAGHVGLLYQMFADGLWTDPPPGTTVFDRRPFNTTIKALMINTAGQWSFSGLSHDLGRFHQGWGYIDVAKAFDLRGNVFVVDEEDVLTEFQTKTYSLFVAPGAPELKATLVYRDNPATLASTVHRINDLDLTLTSPSGVMYRGNQGLLEGLWSTPGGAPDSINTVENVYVQLPETGPWTVEVTASEVNMDTHLETAAVDVDFALVVSGIELELGFRYCDAELNSSGAAARMDAFGSRSASANDLTLVATSLPPNEFGYFLTSRFQGFVPMPGGSQGNLCLGLPIGRFASQIQNSGAGGSFSATIDLTNIPLTPPATVLAGESWFYQAWFRDTAVTNTSNFTDGYGIVFE